MSDWRSLFRIGASIIDQANAVVAGVIDWSFGGGAALMLQIDHRVSHDIDIFVDDPQFLPLLNPETQGYERGWRWISEDCLRRHWRNRLHCRRPTD